MIIKRHLCGVAVAFDSSAKRGGEKKGICISRPNGSLYSRQKRSIADACEWMRLSQNSGQKAIIFCLTSPGFFSLANQPKFVSAFFNNMKQNYGMREYVWVREMTKRGFPHFHCVALWHPSKWFFEDQRIEKLSLYWSSLFGSDAKNSIRLGSYNPKTKNRTFYLSNEKHAWYLTKYIGKNIGAGSNDYLAEAGFPSLSYRKAVRSFGMSENVALLSEPDLFETQIMNNYEERNILTTTGYRTVSVANPDRVFIGESGQLSERELQEYRWKWTGHGETYIGFKRNKK